MRAARSSRRLRACSGCRAGAAMPPPASVKISASPATAIRATAVRISIGAISTHATSAASRVMRSNWAARRARRDSVAILRRRCSRALSSGRRAGRRLDRRVGVAASSRATSIRSAIDARPLKRSTPMPAQQDLEHELAAEVGEREHDEARRSCSARALRPRQPKRQRPISRHGKYQPGRSAPGSSCAPGAAGTGR